MPHGQKINISNRSNIVTNSIKSFKKIHIKKKEKPKKSRWICKAEIETQTEGHKGIRGAAGWDELGNWGWHI